MKYPLLISAVFLVATALTPVASSAQAVNFIDESGNVHFADSADQVPMRYRDQVVKRKPAIANKEQFKQAQKDYKHQLQETKRKQKEEEKLAQKAAKLKQKQAAKEQRAQALKDKNKTGLLSKAVDPKTSIRTTPKRNPVQPIDVRPPMIFTPDSSDPR